MASLEREFERLLQGSLIYLLPPLVTRGASFALTPLYTAAMTPAEYGGMALAMLLVTFTTLTLSMGAHLSITRLHHSWDSDDDRREFYGTLLLFFTAFPAAIIGLLTLLVGQQADVTVLDFPWSPHIELALVAGACGLFANIPTSILAICERPKEAAAFTFFSSSMGILGNVAFIIVLEQGAYGYLKGAAISSGLVALVGSYVTFRHASLSFSWDKLKASLRFGLPLVPHLVALWALSASDRLVVERYVSREELGIYGLGYSLGTAMGLVNVALDRAFLPLLNRKLARADAPEQVPLLGTYAAIVTALAATLLAALSQEIIEVLTPPAYHRAATVMPWVVCALAAQGVGRLYSQGVFFAKKTGWIPLVSTSSAAANLGLNFVFVPLFGIVAAAISTLASYLAQAAMYLGLSTISHPIQWEHRRFAHLVGRGGAF
ncbi:MAG: lipopolysaccharide biosynthesis protein [Planctomycetota bacterium]